MGLASVCRRSACVLALVVSSAMPWSVGAAELHIGGTPSTLTLISALDGLVRPDYFNPTGTGVSLDEGPLISAPVAGVTVDDVTGALTVRWAPDFRVVAPQMTIGNFEFDVASGKLYADFQIDLDVLRGTSTGEVASFTRLSFLYAKDLWGHIDGSVPLNQALSLSGDSAHTLALGGELHFDVVGMVPLLDVLLGEPTVVPDDLAQRHTLVGQLAIGAAVPEASTWATMALGLVGVALASARARRRAQA